MSATARIIGRPYKINYENKKVLYLIVKVAGDYFSITFFDEKLRNRVKNLSKDDEVEFICNMKPSRYQNKQGQWISQINMICVNFDVIEETIEPVDISELAMIDDDWIPFK